MKNNPAARKKTVRNYYEKNKEGIAQGNQIKREALKVEVFTEYSRIYLKSPRAHCQS